MEKNSHKITNDNRTIAVKWQNLNHWLQHFDKEIRHSEILNNFLNNISKNCTVEDLHITNVKMQDFALYRILCYIDYFIHH